METYFSFDVIRELIRIDERILNSMYELSKLHDMSDFYHYISLINEIKLFYKKEKYLVSQIPKSRELYDCILDFLHDGEKYRCADDKNTPVVVARLYGLMFHLYLNLSMEQKDDEDQDIYAEAMEVSAKSFIRNNLTFEYVSALNGCINDSDNQSVKHFFYNIQLYNTFINYDMFDVWINCNFDFGKINYFSDKEVMKKLDISSDDYADLKEAVVVDCISSLLPEIFTDCKQPKRNVLVQDSFFNFRFLLSKLSDDGLMRVKRSLDDAYFEIGRYGLLEDVVASVNRELNLRSITVDNDDENLLRESYDIEKYDLFVSLIKLEDKLFDTYRHFTFENYDNGLVEQIRSLVNQETELISSLNSVSVIPLANDILNNDLWVYLSGDDIDYKASLIVKRLRNLLPVFREISFSPIHNVLGFRYTRKNHFIRSLSGFRNSSEFLRDDIIGIGCRNLYKLIYYINPDLFEELLMCDGNDLFMCDMSDDIIVGITSMDNDEYQFDKNEYLYGIGEVLIGDISSSERSVLTISDYVNLLFKISRVNDIIDNLDISYVRKLYDYLNDNTRFFSPFRRDLRKSFKARLSSENNKVKKFFKS